VVELDINYALPTAIATNDVQVISNGSLPESYGRAVRTTMSSTSFSLDSGRLSLIFGSQALEFNAESARELRSHLLKREDFGWILETIAELPQYWIELSTAVPKLHDFPGAKLLNALNKWISSGSFPEDEFPLPNILLTPIVVIAHLTQYVTFFDLAQQDGLLRHHRHLLSVGQVETLGLCTGLLSAAAASFSAAPADIRIYGRVAIRLAMAIGAVVDANDTGTTIGQRRWKSFAIAWSSPERGDDMAGVMERFPEVWLPVTSIGFKGSVS
jgi:hypothetical protein